MKLPKGSRNYFRLLFTDYAWYYLYFKPRYALDRRYRKSHKMVEEMLREVYLQEQRRKVS